VNTLTQQSSRESEKNHEKPQSERTLHRSSFEPGTTRIHVMNFTCKQSGGTGRKEKGISEEQN